MITRRVFALSICGAWLCVAPPAYSTIPDCDGSNPMNMLCGSAQDCSNHTPTLSPQSCGGNQIYQQNGQFACSIQGVGGKGSTLCGDSDPLENDWCTGKKPCTPQQGYVDHYNPETGERITVMMYWCGGSGTMQGNSVKQIKDNVLCKDTTGG